MEKIAVYRTNISSTDQARRLKKYLLENFKGLQIHFDLSDCDKILRIASEEEVISTEIQSVAKSLKISVTELED